jgi:hypothetical protein
MQTYSEIAKENTQNQDNWICEVWGDFGEFHNDVKVGDTLSIPINCIVPRSKIEYENSDTGCSYSNDLIELTFNKMGASNESRKAELIIFDGHNRFQDVLKSGAKYIKVRIA